MGNADGSQSTHLLASGETGNRKRPYEVNPTIFPNNGGKTWINLGDKPKQAYKEALKRGEVVGFKSARREKSSHTERSGRKVKIEKMPTKPTGKIKRQGNYTPSPSNSKPTKRELKKIGKRSKLHTRQTSILLHTTQSPLVLNLLNNTPLCKLIL